MRSQDSAQHPRHSLADKNESWCEAALEQSSRIRSMCINGHVYDLKQHVHAIGYLNAMLKAACEGLSLQYLLGELGEEMMLHLRGGSSASHGTLQRLGSGRIKHLQTRQLWLQEKVYAGEGSIEKIGRAENWADSLTHPWTVSDERHFESMGVRSVGGSFSRTQG